MIDLMQLGASTKMNGDKADSLGMITPYNIVTDMNKLITEHIENHKNNKNIWDFKFLDIACKSGNFLRAIYKWLMNHPDMINKFEKESDRHSHIVQKQIFGVCFRETDMLIANRNTFGTIELTSNIKYIYNWQDKIKLKSLTEIQETLKETLGQMKFDIVVGNPPYNNDIYLDFVTKAHGLIGGGQHSSESSNGCVCMITPAKWQAKGGEKNEEFRKNIVPYMKEIIYYPDCRELFDISESDGISYYLVDSCKHYSKNIKNICKKQRYFNGTDVRDIQNSINIAVNLIVDKIKKVNNVHMQIDPDRTYWIKANTPLEKNYSTNNVGVYGGNSDGTKMLYGYINRKELNKHIADIDKYKVIMHFKQGNGYFTLDNSGTTNGLKPTNIFNPGEICKDDYMCLYVTDNETEALSFKSYLDTRFVRFLAYCGCIGDNASNQETWRFIPHPGKFDHIFTDVELYEKYNLTPEEIEIIESIIKERK